MRKQQLFISKSNSETDDGQKRYIKAQKTHKLFIFFSRIIIFITFLLIWQFASDKKLIDSFYFSSPLTIAELFTEKLTDGTLINHIGITMFESGLSFLLIVTVSLLCASLFWFNPTFGKTFEPFLIVLNSLPKSALAPLIIVWLGTGPRTIIICGMSVGVFGCILNLYQAFSQTDAERLKLIETLGGSKFQAFTKVVFPGTLPTFISISKVNIGLALVGVIIGEFLAGRQGLGYLIIYSSQTFQLSFLILSIVILCIIAMMLYWVMSILEKKFNYD